MLKTILKIKTTCHKCQNITDKLMSFESDCFIKCENCGISLIEMKQYSGYVYILSNPSFNGLLKIGCTIDIERRIQELSSMTGVPESFILEVGYLTYDHEEVEGKIHRFLDNYRFKRNREFFKMDLEDAIEKISSLLCEEPYYLNPARVKSKKSCSNHEEEEQKNDDSLFCSKCMKFIEPPSTRNMLHYALFWRDKRCPICNNKLFKPTEDYTTMLVKSAQRTFK